jgi:hypothetical protein
MAILNKHQTELNPIDGFRLSVNKVHKKSLTNLSGFSVESNFICLL